MTKAPAPRSKRTGVAAALPQKPADPVSTEAISPTELPHPEELRATLDAAFGKSATIHATARCTPAGLVTAGLMVSAVLLSVASVVWAARRSPTR